MTIELTSSELVPIVGGLITLVGLLIAALLLTVGAVRTGSKTNGELTASFSATLIAMNNELQESVKDRRASEAERRASEEERKALRDQVSTLAAEKNLLTAEVSQVRREIAQIREDNAREIAKVREEAKAETRRLQIEMDAKDIKIREQDQKIIMLNSEREALKNEVDALRLTINGKVDKVQTDEIEPGETAPDVPEGAPEPKEQI